MGSAVGGDSSWQGQWLAKSAVGEVSLVILRNPDEQFGSSE